MSYKAISFQEKLSKFNEHWTPKVIAEINDYQIKLVKIEGDFIWHNHPYTDELFIVLSGNMSSEFRDGQVDLTTGEMFVVPKGIEHKPFAANECHIMLIEPKGLINTGDVGGDLTAVNDIWV